MSHVEEAFSGHMSAPGLTSSIRHSPGNRAGLFPANNREAQSSRLPGLELAGASLAEVLRDSNMQDVFPLPGRCPREIYQNDERDNRDQQSPSDDPGKNNIIRVEHLSSPPSLKTTLALNSMSSQLGKSLTYRGVAASRLREWLPGVLRFQALDRHDRSSCEPENYLPCPAITVKKARPSMTRSTRCG